MSRIDDVINSLTEEELDLLNSDEQMLSEFKAKYSQPEPSLAESAVGLTKEFSPFPTSREEFTQGGLPTTPFKPIVAATNIGTLGRVDPNIREEFSRGAIRGASFGMLGGQSESEKLGLEGSVMNPESKLIRASRNAGEFTGMTVPILASEITGGAAMAGLPIMRGAGLLGKSVAEGLGTGLTYEAAKGAVTNRTPLETGQEMAKSGSMFAGLGMVGQGMGYLRRVFGSKLAEQIENHFINTPQKLAEKLVEQKKPSLGEQFSKTELTGFKNRQEVFDLAEEHLGKLENRIGGQLQLNLEKLKTPVIPSPSSSERLALPYKPTTVGIQPEPISQVPLAGQTARLPAVPKWGEFKELPDYNKESPTLMRRLEVGEGGMVTEGGRAAGGRFQKGGGKGEFLGETPAGIAADAEKHRELQRFAAEKYGLKDMPGKGFQPVGREGTIDTAEIASAVDSVSEGYRTGTHVGEITKVKRLKETFLAENPKRMTLSEAMGLKRKLDDQVAKVYEKEAGAKVSVSVDVDESLANALRAKIYKINPEIGKLAAEESLMIRIRAGLKSKVAKSGANVYWSKFWNNLIFGTPVANVTAKNLRSVLGTPSPVMSEISKRAARVGLPIYQNESR